MVTVCRNCGKVLGTVPPYDNTERIYIRCQEGCDPDLRQEKRNQDK